VQLDARRTLAAMPPRDFQELLSHRLPPDHGDETMTGATEQARDSNSKQIVLRSSLK
jgi:hypothetical protein